MKKKLLFILLVISCSSFAKSTINLLFHIGLGADGRYEIGGTIENDSPDESIYSAITYIIIDKKCVPRDAKIKNLGTINPKSKLDFRIPIEGVLSSYRILNVTGWNNMGIPVDTEDKTAEIIKKRDEDTVNYCSTKHIN